jgi:hypothetical protein
MAQKQAIRARDMGLALLPDASLPFSFDHLDGLSHWMVLHDLEGILAPMEAAELFFNPTLFAVMRKVGLGWCLSFLYGIRPFFPLGMVSLVSLRNPTVSPCSQIHEIHRRAQDADDPAMRPRRVPRTSYWEIPGFFKELEGDRLHAEWARFDCLLTKLARLRTRLQATPLLTPDVLTVRLGELAKPCFIPYSNDRTAAREPGLHLVYRGVDAASLVVHQRVLENGAPGFDPVADAACLSIPDGWPARAVVRGTMADDWSEFASMQLRPHPEKHPAVTAELKRVNHAFGLDPEWTVEQALDTDDPEMRGVFETLRRKHREAHRVVISNPKYIDGKALEVSSPGLIHPRVVPVWSRRPSHT